MSVCSCLPCPSYSYSRVRGDTQQPSLSRMRRRLFISSKACSQPRKSPDQAFWPTAAARIHRLLSRLLLPVEWPQRVASRPATRSKSTPLAVRLTYHWIHSQGTQVPGSGQPEMLPSPLLRSSRWAEDTTRVDFVSQEQFLSSEKLLVYCTQSDSLVGRPESQKTMWVLGCSHDFSSPRQQVCRSLKSFSWCSSMKVLKRFPWLKHFQETLNPLRWMTLASKTCCTSCRIVLARSLTVLFQMASIWPYRLSSHLQAAPEQLGWSDQERVPPGVDSSGTMTTPQAFAQLTSSLTWAWLYTSDREQAPAWWISGCDFSSMLKLSSPAIRQCRMLRWHRLMASIVLLMLATGRNRLTLSIMTPLQLRAGFSSSTYSILLSGRTWTLISALRKPSLDCAVIVSGRVRRSILNAQSCPSQLYPYPRTNAKDSSHLATSPMSRETEAATSSSLGSAICASLSWQLKAEWISSIIIYSL